ncbi:sensor histidine kinase [Brachybacterium sp. FME24]|uniref:sensor histidine kinase n=1 Tax=Brachybacterium sp. FME24 TaxID=2742605 RepID=UPI0018688752|nr:histidine kinase [Brachybacterium sp. FME24]
MSSTSIAARRRLHRATVLTTVVAIAPVTLAIAAMTSQSWQEGLGFSVGIMVTFLVLLEFEPARHPRSTALAVAFSFAIWVICALLALNPLAFFGAAILSGVLIPQLRGRHLFWIIGVGALIAAIGGLYFVTEPVTWVNVVRFVVMPGGLSVFVAAVILMIQGYWGIIDDLEIAQEAEAELGIMRERMRFASDLHDIQGHTLHVVNLKVALAEELLHREPERAMTELREVYAQVEETIRETKNLAYAQRKLNLRAELENARNLLDAAGATVRITREGEARAGIGELLGQVLREATTNILRHAQPTRVAITLSEAGIEIVNDGAPDGALPALRGLETLRARVASEGGSLAVAQSLGEFRTAAHFPAPVPVEPSGRRVS